MPAPVCSSLAFTSLPLAEALARIRALGFTQVELPVRCDQVWPGHLDAQDLMDAPDAGDAVATTLATSGLTLSGVGYEGRKDQPLTGELPRFSALASLVARMGGRTITVFLYDDGAVPSQVRYPALLAVAREHGLQLLVETHLGTATADPVRALELTRELDLRLCLDASHYVVQGFLLAAWAPLLASVDTVQVRRCLPGSIQLAGPRQADEVDLAVLLPSGFTGAVVIEYIDLNDGPASACWDATIAEVRTTLVRAAAQADRIAATHG